MTPFNSKITAFAVALATDTGLRLYIIIATLHGPLILTVVLDL